MAGNQYVSSVKYAAVPVWTASATLAVGAFRRQVAPADSVARVFRVSAITTGVTGGAEPSWNTGAGQNTTDGGVTWTEATGSAWNAPHKCIQNAVQNNWGSTDNCFIYVDSAHNFVSVAATNINWFGVSLNFGACRKIVSVNAAGSVPPGAADLLAGAKETTSGTADFNNQPQSGSYIDGVSVIVGLGSAATSSAVLFLQASGIGAVLRWKNGGIALASTDANCVVQFGMNANGNAAEVEFVNFTWKFGHVNQIVQPWSCRWSMTGGSIDAAGSKPTVFIDPTTHQNSTGIIEGMDLSALTGTVIGHANNTSSYTQLADCKLGTAAIANWTNSFLSAYQGIVDVINSNTGAVNYDRRRYAAQGTQTIEIVNVRSGGATNGTTAFAWKVVTNNTPSSFDAYVNPFALAPIDIWNTSLAPITVTLNILSSGTLKDSEIGFDLYYLGSGASPKASLGSTIANVLSSGTALTSGSFGWNTSGVGTPVQQQIALTVTPAMAGMLRLQPKVLKASQTVWIDPAPVVT